MPSALSPAHFESPTEATYRSIVEHAIEGIFQTTPDGRYLLANPALARIYGYGNVEELRQSVSEIARQLYVQPDRRAEFIRLMNEQDAVWAFESQIYRKDGSVIWISENVRVIRDEAGEVAYYEGTVADITESKRAQEEMRRRRIAAEEASRSKSQFLANMSHELRTPLNAIIGYSELMREEAEEMELPSFVKDLLKIEGAGKHLLELINSVLDIAKIEAGKMDVHAERFEVAAMMKEVTATIAPVVEKNGNHFEVSVAADVGMMHIRPDQIAPEPVQSARQRGQIYQGGHRLAEGLEGNRAGPRVHRLPRVRHRRRHDAGAVGQALQGVHAGGFLDDAEVRRHRPRTGDHARIQPAARRRNDGGKLARTRLDLHAEAAGRPRLFAHARGRGAHGRSRRSRTSAKCSSNRWCS